jgi:hypothetical protein
MSACVPIYIILAIAIIEFCAINFVAFEDFATAVTTSESITAIYSFFNIRPTSETGVADAETILGHFCAPIPVGNNIYPQFKSITLKYHVVSIGGKIENAGYPTIDRWVLNGDGGDCTILGIIGVVPTIPGF